MHAKRTKIRSHCIILRLHGQKQSQNWCNVSIHRSWHVEEEHFSFSKAYYVHVFARVYTDVRPLSCPVTSRTNKTPFLQPHTELATITGWNLYLQQSTVCLFACGFAMVIAMKAPCKSKGRFERYNNMKQRRSNIIEPPQIFTPIKQSNIHELHQLSSLQNFPWWRCVRLDLCKPCLRGWENHFFGRPASQTQGYTESQIQTHQYWLQ